MADENNELLEQIRKQQEQINNLSKQMETAQQDMVYAMSRRQKSQPQPQQTATQYPELDLSGLPDPEYDREAYNREFQKRMKNWQEETVKAARTPQQSTDDGPNPHERNEAMWEDFQERFPKYAKSKALVGAAASEVLERARKRGADTDEFMYGHTSAFFNEVAKQMEKELKGLGVQYGEGDEEEEEEEGEEGHTSPGDLRGASYDEYQGMRTKGILGGSTGNSGGGKKKGSGKKAEPSPEDAFAAELAEFQKRGGYM